jgi:hypothetical protein
MRWRRTFMAEVSRTLQQAGMKACPVCGLAESLNMNDFPVLLADGRLPLGVDALGEYHEGDLTFALRMDCITCGHLMLFDAQRYRTGEEKILVLGMAEGEDSLSGELPPLEPTAVERPGVSGEAAVRRSNRQGCRCQRKSAYRCDPVAIELQDLDPMPLSLIVAVGATGPEMGLQSRWYRQHRSPHAPEPPEPGESPVSPGPSQVKVQFHLVQRRADLHDQLKSHEPLRGSAVGHENRVSPAGGQALGAGFPRQLRRRRGGRCMVVLACRPSSIWPCGPATSTMPSRCPPAPCSPSRPPAPGELSPADGSGPRELLAYRSAQGRRVVAAMILSG